MAAFVCNSFLARTGRRASWMLIRNSSSSIQKVRIVEVGPRDGLQNEKAVVPSDVKIGMVEELVGAGMRNIEVTGFVSPKWIPQLADAKEVFSTVRKEPGVEYSALVPNLRGLKDAVDSGVQTVAVFAAASETFSKKNINRTIDESLDMYKDVCASALSEGLRVRGYVSTVVGCPYEGSISPDKVLKVTQRLLDMGCFEVSLGDTIGVATPHDISQLLFVLTRNISRSNLAVGGSQQTRSSFAVRLVFLSLKVQSFPSPLQSRQVHFHDTRGTALANVLVALQAGITTFDSSVGGLGGCPYAPGAAGNLATEDLVYMLRGMKLDIGDINIQKVAEVGARISRLLNRPYVSKCGQAILSSAGTESLEVQS